MAENPFLDPAFLIPWPVLTPDLVAPAIEGALTRAQAAIDAICARAPSELTFENSFLALERATEELTVAWGKVTHLQSVADSPALRDAHNAMLPRVSAFYASVPLNAALWARLKALADSPVAASITGISRRFLEETVKDFRQAGADLPKEKRERLEALQSELAAVTQKYSENVLDATNAWQLLVPEAQEQRLAGLPAHAKAAARQSAAAKGSPGWRFTLHQPSQEPAMTYLEDDALRREIWTAACGVGAQSPLDNTALIARILTLRAEKAALLGRAHFADVVLERRMARSADRALAFVGDFQARCASAFARECRELEEFKAQQTRSVVGPLAPWEVMFWAERLRKDRYAFDEEILRPYFPMNRV
ncbi:MAG: M3 family metallopeptidase, partial [Opitutaceae bacterium]